MEIPVPQSKYNPLTMEEFQNLKKDLDGVKSYLPEHLMNGFWSLCNRIRNEKARQPCSCSSSAKHWAGCVNDLRKFVKDRSE